MFSLGGFEVDLSAIGLGVMTGLTYGVLGVGLVLVYRSNRIVNFAHGEIGAFGAALLSLAVTQWHLPYWLAFVLALGVGAAVGGVSETVIVRRLRNAPALMSVVATLGLAQFLLAFSLVLNSQVAAGTSFPQPPFLPSFRFGALQVTQAHSGMLILTPLAVLAIVLFLRRSRFGLAIRASAANREAARMAGISAGRMSTLTWAIAGALATFTAVLVLPTRGFVSAEFLGPGLLLRALAAGVVARMVNLPVAFLAGLTLGVVEHMLRWNYPGGGLVEAVVFVILLVALLTQPRRGGRGAPERSWAAVQPWSPLPETFQRVWAIRNLGKLVGGAALVVALLLPLYVTNSAATILAVIIAFALVGLSLGVVTGLGGQLSLGQFALAGVGGAVSYAVTAITGNILLGLLAAGLGAAVASLIIGLPALRIRGLMLAVATLGFALAARRWLFEQNWVLGEGVSPQRPKLLGIHFDTGKEYYLFALGVLLLGMWLARNVRQGGLGRRLRALRDNEDAARAFTLPATLVKLQGFVVAGFLAGLGGAVYGHTLTLLSPSAFPVSASIDVAAMAVLGGIGLLAGPLIGALYIIGIPEFLPLDSAGLAASSIGWLILILYFPGGIAQLLRPLRDRTVDFLARQNGLDPQQGRATTAPTPGDQPGALRLELEERSEPTPRQELSHPLLTAEGLKKHYGGVRAVDGVSFQLRAGETLGLIGPNGAGKTTLFELISGFTTVDAGTITFQGRDVTSFGPAALGRHGLIRSFQDPALFPTMTVLDVLRVAAERTEPTGFGAGVAGLTGPERHKDRMARDVLGSMGLYGYRNTSIQELSTGTRRITELACMLLLRPSLLLLDEPSSGIAQRETEALGELLERLRRHLNVTLLVIEHDMPLITSISDRLIAMESGRVLATGDPTTVQRDPEVGRAYLGGDLTAVARSGSPVPALANGPGGPGTEGDQRCTSLTRNGDRCSRRAVAEGLCTQHRKTVVAR